MTHEIPLFSRKLNDRGLFALIGTCVIYILIYTHLASFVTSNFGISSTPVYALIVGLGLLLSSGLVVGRPTPRSTWFIVLSIAAYVFILLINMLFSDSSIFPLIRDRLSWAAATVGGIFVLSNIRNPATFLRIVRVAVAISAAIVLLEFFSHFALPIEMTTVRGRAAGLFENPNIAALFLAAALPVTTIGLKPIGRILWYAAITTCVFLTFSRGGLVVCAVAILMGEAFPADRGPPTLRRVIVIALLVSLAIAFYGLLANFVVANFGSSLESNTLNRVRLGADSASQMRMYVLQLAWEGFSSSPLWGQGVGAGNRWHVVDSVHNMFALVMLEQGVIGLTWIAAFSLSLFSIRKPYGWWAAAMFGAGGLFTHNLFDSPTYGMIFATYAALPAMFASAGARRVAARGAAPRGPVRFRPLTPPRPSRR